MLNRWLLSESITDAEIPVMSARGSEEAQMQRIAVIRTSCSGKTTFASRLSRCAGFPHVELDAMHWGPEWTPKPPDEFRRLVDQATSARQWICDGNYSAVRDIVWPRADILIWLNYPFPTVALRALRRTLARSITGRRLFADNQEPSGLPS